MGRGLLVILLSVVNLLIAVPLASAQSSVDGDWSGTLGTTTLKLVLHIQLNGRSTVDSPQQNAYGMQANVAIKKQTLHFTIPEVEASFEGTVDGTKISGVFSQRGQQLSLVLVRATSATKATGTDVPSSLEGDWEGVIEGPNLPIVIHIHGQTSTTDSPSQNTFRLVTNVSAEGKTVRILIPSVGAAFRGAFDDSQIIGTFVQNNSSSNLTLKRQTASRSAPKADERNAAPSSSLNGDWEGVIVGANLPIIVHIREEGATTDSPSQNVSGMPTNVSMDGKTVQISIPSVGAAFKGRLDGLRIVGTFVQNGSSANLTLKKQDPE